MSELPATEHNLTSNGLGAPVYPKHPRFNDLVTWLVLSPCPNCEFIPHDVESVQAEYKKGNAGQLRQELILHREILNRSEVKRRDCLHLYELPIYLTEEIV